MMAGLLDFLMQQMGTQNNNQPNLGGLLNIPGGQLNAPMQQSTPAGAAVGNAVLLRQALRARENQFQQGIRATPWFQEFRNQYGEEPDLDTKDYDYRAAWAAGLRPTRSQHDAGRYHWPSSLPNGTMLKSQDHPTAWKEHFMRATGHDPDAIGVDQARAEAFLNSLPRR